MSTSTSEPILSVRELNVSFQFGNQRVAVVDGVSFDLAEGEILGLVGESGCGKTMTGAALMGMVPYPAGKVEAEGILLANENLADLDEAGWRAVRGRKISMVFQEPLTALDPVFTIGNQLSAVIKRHQGVKRAIADKTAMSLLESVGLPDAERLMKSYPHELSGGMRQRVMLAMAMSCKPAVLVADEPTTALDVTTQAQILQQIRNLARDSGTAVLLITHDLGVAAQVCDRVQVMYCGRVVEQGPPDILFTQARHPYTAGLLAAVPKITSGPVSPVSTIPGSVPHPAQTLPGCRFNNRCADADALCHTLVPQLRTAQADEDTAGQSHVLQRFACHHPRRPARS